MKYDSKDLEKWVRMNKRPFWEILQGDRKQGVFSFDDANGDLENSVIALNEAIENLPNAEYKIRAKRNQKDPNNSYLTVDFVVNNSSSVKEKTRTGTMSELEKLYQEKLEKALELQRKDFELKSILEKFSALETKFEKLEITFKEFQDEVYDFMDDGQVNGSNNMIKDGLTSIVSSGTKAVVDRFSGLKS